MDKAGEYRRLATVQSYVILEQDRPAVTLMRRAAEGWLVLHLKVTDVLPRPEIGSEVPVSELYEGVE